MPGDFIGAWDEFNRAVRRARARTARKDGEGLTIAQFHLLEPLATADDAPVGVLAEAAGVSRPTATRMVDGLVRDGYAERIADARDRRVVLVSLTSKGSDALAARRADAVANRRRIADRLTPDERLEAAALLRRLAAIVDEEL
jgi:DNA-binding MarR family transcriptional regulator